MCTLPLQIKANYTFENGFQGPCMFDYFEKSIWNGNYCVGYINQSRGDSLARYLVAFISKDKNECVRELIDWIKLRK